MDWWDSMYPGQWLEMGLGLAFLLIVLGVKVPFFGKGRRED